MSSTQTTQCANKNTTQTTQCANKNTLTRFEGERMCVSGVGRFNNWLESVDITLGENHITLRELPTIDAIRLKKATEKGEEETLNFFKEILPSIIVKHDFTIDGVTLSNDEVTDLIFSRLSFTLPLIEEYTDASFFHQERKRELG